jgi:hypothetical protein
MVISTVTALVGDCQLVNHVGFPLVRPGYHSLYTASIALFRTSIESSFRNDSEMSSACKPNSLGLLLETLGPEIDDPEEGTVAAQDQVHG